jgi:hypothetical protein
MAIWSVTNSSGCNNPFAISRMARGNSPHILANLLNDSAKFVPRDGRVRDPIVKLAAVDVEIGTTDARVAGRDQHFVRSDARVGRVAHAYVSIVVEDARFHTTYGFVLSDAFYPRLRETHAK